MKIYHNPRCTKSRETLNLLENSGAKPEIVLYLTEPLTQSELKGIIKKLGITAKQLIRTSEKIFKEEYKGKTLTETQWIKAMIKHPKLMERPIVVKGNKAVIGRPPAQVLELI